MAQVGPQTLEWALKGTQWNLASSAAMLEDMKRMFDAFWRAVAYCLHPRVMMLSLLPLILMVVLALGLGFFYWESAVAATSAWLSSWAVVERLTELLASMGLAGLRSVLAPLVLLIVTTPVLVFVSLVLVAWLMTPALVDLVGTRRFALLDRRGHTGWWVGLIWSLGSILMAGLALLVSMPLWLIPPLVLVLPPLIWGWLTCRVFSFDALAVHALAQERRQIMREHRLELLLMGVLCGYLGAAPTLIWAWGAMTVALAPLLIPVAIWLYTLVMAFSSLWFIHYTLAALSQLRSVPAPMAGPTQGPVAATEWVEEVPPVLLERNTP